MTVISLYWFAAQKQTSKLRTQNSHAIYSKFSLKLSEPTSSFQKLQQVASKLQNLKNA